MAGTAAAAEVARAGRRVIVVDKGRGVGGRMAYRRIGDAVFDHGAQFISTRSARFSRCMEEWLGQGITREWCRGFSAAADGHPRWRGNPNMTALPRHLARGVEISLETRATAVRLEGTHWSTALENGDSILSAAVVLTAPIPQSLALLDAGGFEAPSELRTRLAAIRYERCLAVLAVLAQSSGMPPPGGMAFEEGPIAWIADNELKGISPVPCITIHASHEFSLANWDLDRRGVGRILLDKVAPWIQSGVTDFQTHGWLFSKPLQVHEHAAALLHSRPLMVLAGDAFVAPRVEGAAHSGWAAAEIVLNRLSPS
jgi:renalase